MYTLDWLKPEGWWCLKFHPDANQSKNCAGADHTPCSSLPHTAFNTPSLKVFWAWAAHSPPLAPCNKCCTFLHHNLVSVDSFYCPRMSGPKFGSVTILPKELCVKFLSRTKVLWRRYVIYFGHGSEIWTWWSGYIWPPKFFNHFFSTSHSKWGPGK